MKMLIFFSYVIIEIRLLARIEIYIVLFGNLSLQYKIGF